MAIELRDIKAVIETTCQVQRISMSQAHQWDLAVKAYVKYSDEPEYVVSYLTQKLNPCLPS